VAPEFALWNAWIATWSNVFWNVEPEPFSVPLTFVPVPLDPLAGLELLPHAARRSADAQSAMSVRCATRDDRIDAIKVDPLSEVGIGVETKNEEWMRGCGNVNDT